MRRLRLRRMGLWGGEVVRSELPESSFAEGHITFVPTDLDKKKIPIWLIVVVLMILSANKLQITLNAYMW